MELSQLQKFVTTGDLEVVIMHAIKQVQIFLVNLDQTQQYAHVIMVMLINNQIKHVSLYVEMVYSLAMRNVMME